MTVDGRLLDMMRAAGEVTSPRGTERLHEYWVHGEGAAKIAWGTPGDFARCVAELGKYIRDPEGYCNLAHHAALGIYPATHAKMEHAGRADMTSATRAEMTTQSINDLPDSDFAYIEPGGSKDASGRTVPRDKRHFPLHDVAHVRDALGRAPQSPFGDKAMPKIREAARKYGIDSDGDASGRAGSFGPFYRSFPLEDISIRSGGGGRTVEAYAAVFNTPTEVRDQDGHYMEELDPAVFNRAISDAAPQGGRKNWRIGVFYNHGLTIMGTPSERHSMPIGKIVDIKADSRGLWTQIQYNRTPLADEVLENISEGTLSGYSFSGNFRRSQPLVPVGGFRPDRRTGELPRVRRTESTLKELGPTPFPYYPEAEVLGMRAEQLLSAMAADPETAMRMISIFRGGAPLDSPPPAGAPRTGDSPAEDSPARRRSGRSVKGEIDAARADFLLRYRR